MGAQAPLAPSPPRTEVRASVARFATARSGEPQIELRFAHTTLAPRLRPGAAARDSGLVMSRDRAGEPTSWAGVDNAVRVQRCGGTPCPSGTCSHDDEPVPVKRSAESAPTATVGSRLLDIRCPGRCERPESAQDVGLGFVE
jgi:hypothetical protein